MSIRWLAVICMTLLLLGNHALAQKAYTGTATGNLTVDGKSIPLRYAYAIGVENVEEAGLVQSGPTKYRVIVLSDHRLPLSCVSDRNSPFSERRSPAQVFSPLVKSEVDRMYGIMLKMDSATNMPLHAELFYPGDDSLSFSVVGEVVDDQITGLKAENGQLSGTAFLAHLKETHADHGPKKYQYRVSFQAPLLSEPPVTEMFEGKQVLGSPQVQAIREYMGAAQKSDLLTLRRLTAASHQAYLKKPETLAYLKKGDPSKLAEQVRRVVVRGNTAIVVIVNEKPNDSQVSMQMLREAGAWKLYWP